MKLVKYDGTICSYIFELQVMHTMCSVSCNHADFTLLCKDLTWLSSFNLTTNKSQKF